MTFDKLGLSELLVENVTKRGYDQATAIQKEAIPAILKGQDVLGGAQTGTGKTAAFALPILQLLNEEERLNKHPRALIITPTRELAIQVGESFRHYGERLNLTIATIYGGVKIKPQISTLKNGVDILIATPGRLIDHMNQKTINLHSVSHFILDEADKMLDMGFIRDINKIIDLLPTHRQNLLFSATYDKDIRNLAHNLLKNPKNIEVNKRNSTATKVKQVVHRVASPNKKELLKHLIETENWYQVLVFVRTKHGANRLAKFLDKVNIPSAAIHGDKSQGARNRALKSFKTGDLQALIATDVAARGIHLDDLSFVVNFDLPQVTEDYVHRIGRTGRAGKSGKAITFVSNEESNQLRKIEKMLKTKLDVKTVKGFTPKKNEDGTRVKKKKVPDPFQYRPNKRGKR